MKKVLLLNFLFLFALLGQVMAQSRTITGKVTAAGDGEPLPGVSVVVKGTSVGTATGVDGSYTVNVPTGASTLVFRYIGYQTLERAIGTASSVNVALSSDDKQLNEVVVIAYGTADKGSFVGSASQITSERLVERPITNIASAITGQAAGVQTTGGGGQPGSAPAIRIRGVGSYTSSNDPLYVVDGVPYSGNISNLNPDDIESMSILKDAASSSLYGARAANGVVMITTKRGKKGAGQVNFRMTQGVTSRSVPEYERVDAFQYYPLAWEAHRNALVKAASNPVPMEDANKLASGTWGTRFTSGSNNGRQNYQGRAYSDVSQILGYNPFNVASTDIVRPDGTLNPDARLLYGDDLDWQQPLMRTGRRQDYALSFNGSNDRTDYYVSLGYLNDKGFLIKSDFERFTGRVNVNTQATKWFKTGLNISGNMTQSNQANDESSTGYVNPFFFGRTIGPIYPLYEHDPVTGAYILDEQGNKIYDLGGKRGPDASAGRHILAETLLNDNLFKRNVLSARTYGEVTFLKDFKFTTNLSVDVSNYLASTYQNTLVGDGAPAGRANKTNTLTTSYTVNQLLNYNKTLNDRHFIEVLLGHENYDWTYNYFYGMRQGQISSGNTELVNFVDINSLTSYTDKYRTEGYFSRANYTFDDKYTVSASYRRDGSSRFFQEKRWGDFWSVGASWRLDRESFLSVPSWVGMLKLRGSYGQVGNDAILNSSGNDVYYAWQGLYDFGPGFNNVSEPGFLQASLENKNLVWESNNSFDLGLDFSLLDNKLSGGVEYFQRESRNLLFSVPLPLSSGVLSRLENVGTLNNSGVELHLAADVLKRGDFGWDVDFNWTTIKNEFKKLPAGQDEIISGTKKIMVGRSIYDFWLRQWYGVDPTDGSALYLAQNQEAASNRTVDGVVVTTDINNAKYDYSGSAIPDFYGGITNNLRFKDLSLSFLVTYQVGGKMYDATYAGLMTADVEGRALHKDMLNRWQKPGDVTDVPRLDNANSTHLNGASSTRWLTDASYLNFRSVTLGYNLPSSLTSKVSMQNARLYLTGENLALISARKGMNPTQAFSGVTSNAYLPSRVISLGVNVTL